MFKELLDSSSSSSSVSSLLKEAVHRALPIRATTKAVHQTSPDYGSPPPLDTPPQSTIQRTSPGYYEGSVDEEEKEASPGYAKSDDDIKGGSGSQSFKQSGLAYIKKCCDDAIEIFSTIERIFNK